MAYPYVENDPPAQTPPPAGYHPFHLEHYGRHGSRWLIGANDYLTPVLRLESAERNGKLTPLGDSVLHALREIEQASHQRLGELSDKGAIQHQAIGRRMARNYPEIFNGDADIDAKATVVIRCILSMANALEGIK
ncbi:MAG: histidine-type phosphatase, partial [Muribaculaceae bacterium]|nr:histidine-type phosphatase [Muribaculaceae bacterium]